MQSKKILIVDDDKFLIDMYSLKFRKAEFNVEIAMGGNEAIQKIKDGFAPEIIVLDVIMPGMDGIELLEKIKTEHLADDAILVVLSNQGESTDIERAKKFGVHGYIVKATTIPSEVVTEVTNIYKNNHA